MLNRFFVQELTACHIMQDMIKDIVRRETLQHYLEPGHQRCPVVGSILVKRLELHLKESLDSDVSDGQNLKESTNNMIQTNSVPWVVPSIFFIAESRNLGFVVIFFISSPKQFLISMRILQMRIMSLQMLLMWSVSAKIRLMSNSHLFSFRDSSMSILVFKKLFFHLSSTVTQFFKTSWQHKIKSLFSVDNLKWRRVFELNQLNGIDHSLVDELRYHQDEVVNLDVGVEALGKEPDVPETACDVRNCLRYLRRIDQRGRGEAFKNLVEVICSSNHVEGGLNGAKEPGRR